MIKKLTVISEQELEQIIQVWLEANLDAHDFIAPTYWQNNVALMAEMLPQAEVTVYLDEGNEIIGFIGLMDDYIAGIFVKKAARGQGIGKQLLNYAKGEKSRLSLAVYQKNKPAVSFYLQQGFGVVAEKVEPENNEIEFEMLWEQAKGERQDD